MRILIVDDEPNIRRTLRLALEAMGHDVAEATSGAGAGGQVEIQPYDLALVNLRLGPASGLDLVEHLMEGRPRLAIVVITAQVSLDTAVEAMRRGAFGVLPELPNAVERAAIVAQGPEVGLADLPERIAQARVFADGPIEVGRQVSLERLEAEHIRRVMGSTSSLDGAAQVLGIDPSTLYRKRKKLGL